MLFKIASQMIPRKILGMSQVDADPQAAVASFPLRALGCVSPKRWEGLKKIKKEFAPAGRGKRRGPPDNLRPGTREKRYSANSSGDNRFDLRLAIV